MDSAQEADYVCVLDTGSEDGSVEKLRTRGALVEQEVITPWRFDSARNESLQLIPADADVCCAIDLDEHFHPGWRTLLEQAWQDDTTLARCRFTWSFNSDGSEGGVFWPSRIHKNGCYRWVGAVHEVLTYTGDGSERAITVDSIQLDHRPDPQKSRGQYLPLLELAVAEDPESDRNWHYLGREYMYCGEWEKAIAALLRHLSLPRATWADERCASMRYIGRCYRQLGRSDFSAVWFHRAIAEAPHLREPYIDFAGLLFEQKDWYGLAHICRRALTIRERPRTYICEADAWGSLPYDYLSLAYAHLGRLEQAIEAVKTAIELSPQEERLKSNLEIFRKMLLTGA